MAAIICAVCKDAKGLPCSNCAGRVERDCAYCSAPTLDLCTKRGCGRYGLARREAEHPHDWPYCAGEKSRPTITDTQRLEHLRGVILKALDSWWPLVHSAVGASERARNLRKELADAIQPGAITDTQRLDFVIAHKTNWYPGYYDGTWQKDEARGTLVYGRDRKEIEGATMRDAIDAAIRAQEATK